MRAKVKIKKHDIKQDKFTTFMLQSREWLTERWQPVALGAAVVVVIVIAIVYYNNIQSGKNVQGAARLTVAISEMRQQNYEVAISELTAIADEYGGQTAEMALFNLGNAQYEYRNYDAAMESFQRYLNKYSKNKYNSASALAGIAACLENKQEYLSGGDKFKEAATKYPGSPSEPDYYLGAVRCYVMAGDSENANLMVEALETKFPNSDFARRAAMMVMQLKTQ